MCEPIWTPGKPSSFTQRLISSTAKSGACMGSVPRPTNLLGWLCTVCAKLSFKRTQRSSVSWGFACNHKNNVTTGRNKQLRDRRTIFFYMGPGFKHHTIKGSDQTCCDFSEYWPNNWTSQAQLRGPELWHLQIKQQEHGVQGLLWWLNTTDQMFHSCLCEHHVDPCPECVHRHPSSSLVSHETAFHPSSSLLDPKTHHQHHSQSKLKHEWLCLCSWMWFILRIYFSWCISDLNVTFDFTFSLS